MNEQGVTSELVGLIAAAGPGTRLYPEGKKRSKVLLHVDGKSLLERNLSIMANDMGIGRVVIITGKNGPDIEKLLSTLSFRDLQVTLIKNRTPEKGLAEGILLAKPHIHSPFCLMLGDELYFRSNHRDLGKQAIEEATAVVAVRRGANPTDIRKNYAVSVEDGRITDLMEKPEQVANDLLGCGTFLFKPDLFEAIERTEISARTGRKELADAVNTLIRSGGRVLPFFLTGGYVNVNTSDDLSQARHMVRAAHFDEKTVSLVIPAWNEEDSIGHVIDDFKGAVHQIIVADNCSSDRTAEIAREKGAEVFTQPFNGYGHALRFAMDRAGGDILVLTEADGSFKARDLGKLLEYLKDADMVLGTRTTKQMIQQGANMTLFLRLGNVAVAKLIEMLWWSRHEPRLTDVGCTFRAIWADAWQTVRSDVSADGPSFSPELILEPIRHDLRIIEIPVSYHGRIGGESKHSKDVKASVSTGLSMIGLILRKKLRYLVSDDLMPWLMKLKDKLSGRSES